MGIVRSELSNTFAWEFIISALESSAAHSRRIPGDLRENDELRKRLICAIQELLPELETPAETSQRLLYNVLELTAARIGTDLNLFNLLSQSQYALGIEELAEKTGKNPDLGTLGRVLRYMASVGLVREVSAGKWAASNYGNNLSGKGYGAGVCHVNDSVLPAYAALPDFLRRHAYRPPDNKSDTAFAQGHGAEHGTTFFEWLKLHPDNAGVFYAFMADGHRTGVRTWLDQPEIIEKIINVFDQGTLTESSNSGERVLFVDVGGGMGQQCNALKIRYPELKGKVVLEDLEATVAKAEVEPGIEKVAIDFFQGQPLKGAAAYYMRSVLRECVTILGHLRDAMSEDSILLIDELVLPDHGAHKLETQLDLTMLAMLNGEARTQSQWTLLLVQAGFEVMSIVRYEEQVAEAVIISRKLLTE